MNQQRQREEKVPDGTGARCEHCGGRTFRGTDEEGATVDKCFACGRSHIIAQPEPLAVVVRSPKPDDWVTSALERLADVLHRLRRADDLRAEAERIHAALTIYGASPPALPWRNPLVKQQRSPGRTPGPKPRTYPNCEFCGLQFSNTTAYRKHDGRAHCLDERACRERAAAS